VSAARTDLSGTTVTVLAFLGDRLGLFRALAGSGPATSAELATRAGVHERYARGWLRDMAAAGYLEHEPDRDLYALPP
jgi:DNA-binding IclR family transcriptional regulator